MVFTLLVQYLIQEAELPQLRRIIFNQSGNVICQMFYERQDCSSKFMNLTLDLGTIHEPLFCDQLNITYSDEPVNMSFQNFHFKIQGSFSSKPQTGVSLFPHLVNDFLIIQSTVIMVDSQYKQLLSTFALISFSAQEYSFFAYNSTFDITPEGNYPSSTQQEKNFSALFAVYQGKSFDLNNITFRGIILSTGTKFNPSTGGNSNFSWLAFSIDSEYSLTNVRMTLSQRFERTLLYGKQLFGRVPMAYNFLLSEIKNEYDEYTINSSSTPYLVQFNMCPTDQALKDGNANFAFASYKCNQIMGCQNITIPSFCNQTGPCNVVNGSTVCSCPYGLTGTQCQDCKSGVRIDASCYERAHECNSAPGECLRRIDPTNDTVHYVCTSCYPGFEGACCKSCDTSFDSYNRTFINISGQCIQTVPNYKCQVSSGIFHCTICPVGMTLSENQCTPAPNSVIQVQLFVKPFYQAFGFTENFSYAFDRNFRDLNNSNISVTFSSTEGLNGTSLFSNLKNQFTNIFIFGQITLGSQYAPFGSLVSVASQNTTVTNCTYNMTIKGSAAVGGFIEQVRASITVVNCQALGSIQTSGIAGGIIAEVIYLQTRLIQNCNVQLNINGDNNVGMIVGILYLGSDSFTVNNGRISGQLSGQQNVGVIAQAQGATQLQITGLNVNITATATQSLGLIGDGQGSIDVTSCQLIYNLYATQQVGGIVGSFWLDKLKVTSTQITGTINDQTNTKRCVYGFSVVHPTVTVTNTSLVCNCGTGCV